MDLEQQDEEQQVTVQGLAVSSDIRELPILRTDTPKSMDQT